MDIKRLSILAYPNCPVDMREDLALQYFINAVRDPEIQQALRLADVKNIDSALVYSLKYKAAQQASQRDYQCSRTISTQDTIPELEELKKTVSDLVKEIRNVKFDKEDRNSRIKCWNCDGEKSYPEELSRMVKRVKGN